MYFKTIIGIESAKCKVVDLAILDGHYARFNDVLTL